MCYEHDVRYVTLVFMVTVYVLHWVSNSALLLLVYLVLIVICSVQLHEEVSPRNIFHVLCLHVQRHFQILVSCQSKTRDVIREIQDRRTSPSVRNLHSEEVSYTSINQSLNHVRILCGDAGRRDVLILREIFVISLQIQLKGEA